MNRAVLIISSDDDIAVPLWHALERAQVRAEIIPQSPDAQRQVREHVLAGPDQSWGLIVDAAGGRRPAIELLRQLRAASPELFLLAALDSANLRTAQAAIEAGAWDYLVHPFDAEQIEAFVRLWDTTASEARPPGRLVCFLPARGSDGASTVALHVADAAAREHQGRGFARKVLLVDMDWQAGDLAFRLQLAPQHTLADALDSHDASQPQLHDCVCPWREVDVLAAPPAKVTIPGDNLRRISDWFSSTQAAYPLVIADMPPAIYSCSRDVLALADTVYLVCTPEIASVHLARRRAEELLQCGVTPDKLKLVLNRAGSHPWIGAAEVCMSVGLPISAALDNDYRGLSKAVLEGGVVPRNSPLGRQFSELGREIVGRRVRSGAAAA